MLDGMAFTSRLAAGLRRTAAAALDIALPMRCLVCQTTVMTPGGLCASCWQGLSFVEGGGGLARRLVAEARAGCPEIASVTAAVVFDAASRPVVHALKYRDRQDAAAVMSRQIAAAARDVLTAADLVVCVPMHRFKLWQRRFNQAALIARPVAAGARLPCRVDALRKLRAGRPQVGLSAPERRANVHRAFTVDPAAAPAIYGRRVVLIDDVLTTGATAGACAAELVRHGAASVHVAVYALAPLNDETI